LRWSRFTGFLPLAEEALLEWPGDAHILCLAATAALFDRNPERALVFLKRYSKRYVPTGTHHLLCALAMEQQNKLAMARAILERHGFTSTYDSTRAFPGGWHRRNWLDERLANILGRDTGLVRRRKADKTSAKAGAKTAAKTANKTSSKPAPGVSPNTARRELATPCAAAPPPAVAKEPPGLPRIDIDIPLATAFDLAPLLKAAAGTPEREGAWYGLRERFAHLGLAQGFDELLCLPAAPSKEGPSAAAPSFILSGSVRYSDVLPVAALANAFLVAA
jgi:hypothetical protein